MHKYVRAVLEGLKDGQLVLSINGWLSSMKPLQVSMNTHSVNGVHCVSSAHVHGVPNLTRCFSFSHHFDGGVEYFTLDGMERLEPDTDLSQVHVCLGRTLLLCDHAPRSGSRFKCFTQVDAFIVLTHGDCVAFVPARHLDPSFFLVHSGCCVHRIANWQRLGADGHRACKSVFEMVNGDLFTGIDGNDHYACEWSVGNGENPFLTGDWRLWSSALVRDLF